MKRQNETLCSKDRNVLKHQSTNQLERFSFTQRSIFV